MLILGLAGQAGVGKDTVANYLRDKYGFVVFAFSDSLYREVQLAFSLPDQTLLRDRTTKEVATPLLAPNAPGATDEEFAGLCQAYGFSIREPMSPRQVLQLWGTEYRRAQNPDYWLKQCEAFLSRVRSMVQYPEHAPQHFVNTTTRFPNEQAWVHAFGGNVWHIRRDVAGAVHAHISETPLPVLEGERELWNNDTIDRLHMGVDILLGTSAKFVKVEPMAAPKTEHENAAA